MSRLGKLPIDIPAGVTVSIEGGMLKVKGGKGELVRPVKEEHVAFALAEGSVTLTPMATDLAPKLWGTYASHLKNMIVGVTEGYQKVLEIEGVGYRAELKGSTLVINVGFSHPVEIEVPADITVTVEKSVITVAGIDKERIGQFAANIRAVKKPEPYKGKGIRYKGEYIIRKQGKKAV